MTKFAIITGASSGIGRALCDEFASDGISLILVSRNKSALEITKSELKKQYDIEVEIIIADLSRHGSVATVCSEITNRKLEVEYLVNNAGFGNFGQVIDTDWPILHDMIQLNIFSTDT